MTKQKVPMGILLSMVITGASAPALAGEVGWNVIRGTIHFERRQTVVPLAICDEGSPCPRSRPYWSVLVDCPHGRYEINETYALGSERAPLSVEISGSRVRPGSHVVMEGKVEPISEDFGIVWEVKNLEVVPD